MSAHPHNSPQGLSLIMATLGRATEVGEMIASLGRQTDPRFELIVVDQNPDDRLLPYIEAGRSIGLDIRHERISRHGLSHARNHGLRFARYSHVGFPDDDCWYEPDVVVSILAGFAAREADALLARWIESGRQFPGGTRLVREDWRNFRGEGGSSITLFVRRDLISELKGFDEALGVGAHFGAAEETDLILRLLDRGARIEHYPAAAVHHPFGTWVDLDWSRLCRQSWTRGRGTGALYAKHGIPLPTILRGCIGPLVQPLLRGQGWRAALSGWVTVSGRLGGMCAWHMRRT